MDGKNIRKLDVLVLCTLWVAIISLVVGIFICVLTNDFDCQLYARFLLGFITVPALIAMIILLMIWK